MSAAEPPRLDIANAMLLLANLGVLGLSLKLYTEYVKDRAQDRRVSR